MPAQVGRSRSEGSDHKGDPVTHPRFGVSEIALTAFMSAPVALALLISTTIASGQFRANEPDADPEAQASPTSTSFWLHNGSAMYLVASGEKREFYYQEPRSEMVEAGARQGSLLFTGISAGGRYVGTAYIYNPQCGRIGYPVSGPILDGYQRVSLRGRAPLMSLDCRVKGHVVDNLEFTLLKLGEAAPASAIGIPYELINMFNAETARFTKMASAFIKMVIVFLLIPSGRFLTEQCCAVLCKLSILPYNPKTVPVPLYIDGSIDNPHSAKAQFFVRNHSWVRLDDERLVDGELWSHVVDWSDEYNPIHEGWVKTKFLTRCEVLIVA
jgi:hypothetical protein